MKAADTPTVFLSYAHEDRPEATRLYSDLTSAGLSVWFDQESLLPGRQWKPAIRTAIRNSRFFVALISSRSSTKRGFVNREFSEAFEVLAEFAESAIFLIPVRLDDCEPPHSRLLDLHTVDLFPDWDAGVTRLLRALGAPRLLSRASPPFNLTVLSPKDGARVAHATRFEGMLNGPPPDGEIWIVTEPSRSNFHPSRGPVHIDGTRWFGTASIGNHTVGADTGRRFTVHIALVTREIGRRFQQYLDRAHVTGGWVGLPSLYEGRVLSTIELIRDDGHVK